MITESEMKNISSANTITLLSGSSRTKNTNLIISYIVLIMIIIASAAGAQNKSGNLSDEQKSKINSILSAYNNATLSSEQAKEIHEKFRIAGIHAGPETKDVIISAGFDPEKLNALAPPPAVAKAGKQKPMASEMRLKIVEEKIIVPLALDAAQASAVNSAFAVFYEETDKIKKTQPKGMHIDKSVMQPLEKARNEKIQKVLSDDQFKKFIDLEKSARPPKPDAKSNQQNK